MVKRLLLVSGLAIGLVVAAHPGGAQQYPPGTFFLTLSDTTVVPGQTITATGRVTPGATSVSFAFFSEEEDVGTSVPDDDGNFSHTLTIPSNATPGNHTITATDNTGLELSAAVTVVSAGEGAAGAGAGAGAAGAGAVGAGAVGAREVGAREVGAGGGLPRTGDNLAVPLLRAGAVLLALGGLLVFLTRRRRGSTAST
jgi:LPXTG-motif cell wall-anchored protein